MGGIGSGGKSTWPDAMPESPMPGWFCRSILQLFRSTTRDDNGCWTWHGSRDKNGYGRVKHSDGDRQWLEMAHRFSYRALHGAISDGLTIDHLCYNTSCVNPDHLRAVDLRTNILAGNGHAARNARKTHCKNGHPLSGDNLHITKTDGYRFCRTCGRDSMRRQRAAKRARQ